MWIFWGEDEMYENVVDINAKSMRMILVIILIAIITFPKPKSFKARIVNLATEKCQMMTSYVPLFVFVFVSIIFSFCEANFALVFLTSWVPATRCQSWKWFPLVVHSHKTAGWWQDFLAFNLKHESRRTFLEVEINQSFADTWYIWRCIVFWKEIKKMINL